MSKIGGYAIINLKDVALTFGAAETTVVPGVYAQALAALTNRKAVLISGLNGGDTGAIKKHADTWATISDETEGTLTVRGVADGKTLLLHIDNNDGVIAEVG